MGKTILIASIIAGIAIMLLVSSQLVYAPAPQANPAANRVTFSFDNAATTNDSITKMQGGGMWVKGGLINAAGSFTNATGTGSWHADTLGTFGCGKCFSQSPSLTSVAFNATFRLAGGTSFVAEVVIGTGANNTDTGDTENFWAGPPLLGFGTANVRFN